MNFESKNTIKLPRKSKWCYWCGEECPSGIPRVHTAGVWEGDFYSAHYHVECSEARERWWLDNRNEETPDEGMMARGKTFPKS